MAPIDDGGAVAPNSPLTLRDVMALVTLHGMLSSAPPTTVDRLKADADTWMVVAYWWADAMLRVRKASQ